MFLFEGGFLFSALVLLYGWCLVFLRVQLSCFVRSVFSVWFGLRFFSFAVAFWWFWRFAGLVNGSIFVRFGVS